MDLGAEIKTYGTPCEERRKLGLAVTDAVGKLYECRNQWKTASRDQQQIGKAFSDLQAARAALDTARHAYDEHLRVHGCLRSGALAARV